MSQFGRLYRGETEFDFIGNRRKYFYLSLALIAVSAIFLATRGLDGSVDFTGGTIIEAENRLSADDSEVLAAVEGFGLGSVRVQFTTSAGGERVRVQTETVAAADQDALVMAIAGVAGVAFDETNVDSVGPTFGAGITRRAITALVWFVIVVAAFIAIRFEAKMSAGAIGALFHDLVITAGIYSVVGFQVTPATVIAVLTILGYSLYDTVVVFDKITENVRELSGRYTFTEIANLSMNQVLMRSINTSLTSLLPIGSLLFVGSFLLGATTLREFALALFIGVAAGTYSSIFIATPLLTMWKEREPEWQRMRLRAARRGTLDPSLTGETPAETPAEMAQELRDTGVVARPPRKRRKRR
jgi:preprotein translocase subunit SecF